MFNTKKILQQVEQNNRTLEEINQSIKLKLTKDKGNQETERFEKKKAYAQMVTSITAVCLSIASLLFTVFSFNESSERQQETQAYNYWQNFLQLAVQHPDMANGDDSKYYSINKNDSAKRVEYAWFVANALGAAEIVYRLQKDDEGWRNTLQEIISLHSEYIKSGNVDADHYSGDFGKFVQKAVQKK